MVWFFFLPPLARLRIGKELDSFYRLLRRLVVAGEQERERERRNEIALKSKVDFNHGMLHYEPCTNSQAAECCSFFPSAVRVNCVKHGIKGIDI